MLKKSISVLLALVMILSIFTIIPVSASAEEVTDKTAPAEESASYEADVEFVTEETAAQEDPVEPNEPEKKEALADTGAEEDIVFTGDNGVFQYSVNSDNTVTIKSYIGTESRVTIPETLDGYPVTKIGATAFADSGLTNVNLPDSITSIGGSAFARSGLTSIDLPESLTSIGSSAFEDCDGLTEIIIPKNVTDGYRLFGGCDNLKTVSFQNGMEEIPSSILWGAASVKSVNIPGSVTKIGATAFADSGLTNVDLPDSITSIGGSAFSNCDGLTSIDLSESLTSIGGHAFSDCDGLTSIDLPESLTRIESSAFEDCDGLTEILIPKNVTYAYCSFEKCDNLKTVSFQNGMEEIPSSILWGAASVKSVNIPGSVTKIGATAFASSGLTSIDLPDSITSIGGSAFSNCDGLTEIIIPKNVTVGFELFEKCDNLKTVSFQNGMKVIPSSILADAASVESVNIPESVTKIGSSAFASSGVISVTLPESITSIGGLAFARSALTSIDLPESLTSIGSWAFEYCDGLTEIIIPKNVKDGYGLFEYCDNLKTVSFQDGMKEIPSGILWGAASVTSVTIPGSVTKIGSSAFANCSEDLVVYCPKYSFSTIYFIDKGYGCVSTDDKRLSDSVILNDSECNFSMLSGSKLRVTCNYSIKDSMFEKASDYSVKIHIPDGATVSDNSLYLDKSLLTDFTDEGDSISIPVTKQSGKITFNLDVNSNCKLRSFAILNYRMDGKKDYDIIDVINEDIDLISLYAEDVVSSEKVKVSGVAPANSNVDIYVNDEKRTTLKANKACVYSGEITLSNPVDDTQYLLKAVSSDNEGNEISAERKVKYITNAPELLSFTMDYNGKSYDLTSGEKQSVVFRLEHVGGVTPFKFKVKYSNRDKIDSVYVTSTRNQVTKMMKAEYDPSTDTYIASGFFDDSNHDYVPGKLNVKYVKKTDDDFFPLDPEEEFDNEVPEVFQDATYETIKDTENHKEVLIDLGNGKTITYTYDKLSYEEFVADYEGTDSLAETGGLASVGTDDSVVDAIKFAEKITSKSWGYFNNMYSLTDSSDPYSDVYWNWEEGTSYAIKESLKYNVNKEVTKSFIAEFGKELGKEAASEFFFVVDEGMEFMNICDTEIEFNSAVAKIKSSSLPESVKQKQIKELRAARDAAIDMSVVKMVGTALKFSGGLVLAECPVLGAALWAVGFYMTSIYGNEAEFFKMLSMMVESLFGFWLDFSIDPSGYIYAGVTSNRVADAKVTAYWIPFDEEDEDFWDNPDESKAEIWDASEYSQINPLTTDNDGNYVWDVPEGLWKVVVEKDGYETYSTDWLPVPPPQMDVNINLMSTAVPTLKDASCKDGVITLTFSEYMKPETINTITVKDKQGAVVGFTIDYAKDETDTQGNVFAKEYNLILNGGGTPGETEYTVTIKNAQSYSGVKSGDITGKSHTERLLGDVDGDGVVDAADVAYINRKATGIAVPNTFDPTTADVDKDGFVTVMDATAIQYYLANMMTSYPIGKRLI